MISRKKLVRIGILPLALAFVRPGYSYKGPAPRAPRFQLYRWLSGGQRRGHNLRPQTGPPMHVNVPKGFEIGAGVAACGRRKVAHIKSPVPSLRQLILGAAPARGKCEVFASIGGQWQPRHSQIDNPVVKESSDSGVKLEQATQSVATVNGPGLLRYVRRREEEKIAFAPVVPFGMIMIDVLI
jgi:hypothetical protein